MDILNRDLHPLLAERVVESLRKNDIQTARDFVMQDTQKLTRITSFSFKEVHEVKGFLQKKYAAPTESALAIYKDILKNCAIIPSGIEKLDELLTGGIFTGYIYEICGKAASGKTLLSYVFIKKLVISLKQNCYFLDAKSDFNSSKFSCFCQSNSEVINEALSRIFVKNLFNKYDLLKSLQDIAVRLENNFSLRLIVIDSISAILLENTDYKENNFVMEQVVNLMHYIITKYHVVIVVTNLLTTWTEGDFVVKSHHTTTNICCGKFWYTVPNTRLIVDIQKGDWKIEVEKSNMVPPGFFNKISSFE